MSGAAASVVMSFLIATALAALFHLLFGGPATRIVQYVIMSCIGFLVGHLLGRWFNYTTGQIGAVSVISASAGSVLMLLFAKWLWDTPQTRL